MLIPGAAAPELVSNDLAARMKPGSVLVDIATGQGGCFEESHPTTHADPVFGVHGSTFYCVANMPGAGPCTSTYALTNATSAVHSRAPEAKGWHQALRQGPALAKDLNTYPGQVTHAGVSEAHRLAAVEPESVLA